MYNYLPLLLVGAGRLLLREIGRRREQATQSPPELPSSPSVAPAPVSPPPDPRVAQERALYGGNPMNLAVGLLAKLAKADGVVTRAEIAVVERIFADCGLTGETRELAIHIFQGAKDGPLTYENLLTQFRCHSQAESTDRPDLVFLLLRMAHADRAVLSRQAEGWIQTACTRLDVDYQQSLAAFQAWREAPDPAARAAADQLKGAYETLVCTPADSDERLRQRYRQLARDFHPDTIAGKGLSPEFVRFAEEKFKQIQAAYELVVERRK